MGTCPRRSCWPPVSGHARRIAIKLFVVLATLRHPIHLAEDLAVADLVTGGRLHVTLGAGYRKDEFLLFGVKWKRRPSMMVEIVETLRAAWRHGPLELARAGLGADRRLEVLPRTVDPAGIAIAVAGGAQQTPEWIAEHADASLDYPRDLGALRVKTREWRRLTGDGGKPYLTPMVLNLCEDPGAAPRPIRLGLSTGSRALVDHLEHMSALGVAHVSFNLRPNDRPVNELLQELAEDVLPHFRTPAARTVRADSPRLQ